MAKHIINRDGYRIMRLKDEDGFVLRDFKLEVSVSGA